MYTYLKYICFIFLSLVYYTSFGQRDTISTYVMGEIERVDGLLYGSKHTLVLYSDSSFTYHVKYGNQISTSQGVQAQGKFTITGDTVRLSEIPDENIKPSFQVFSSMHRPDHKTTLIRLYFGECLSCQALPPMIVFSNGSSTTVPLHVRPRKRSERINQLSNPVDNVGEDVEVDLAHVDSIRICGVTLVADTESCNLMGVICRPAFAVRMVQQSGKLYAIGSLKNIYVFNRKR